MKKSIAILLAALLLVSLAACAQKPGAASETPAETSMTAAATAPAETTAAETETAGAEEETTAPFASISAAVLAAAPGDTVIVRGGVYRETVCIAGGEEDQPITLRAEEGARPMISGADPIKAEWTVYKDAVYVADVTAEVTNLFVDDREMLLARWPNARVDDLVHMERAKVKAGSNCRTLNDSELPQGDLVGARVNVVPGVGYNAYSRIIADYTAGESLTFDHPVSESGEEPEGSDPFVPKYGNAYYLVGALDLLDAPGEWYYDAAAGKLYLYTEQGDSPAKHAVSFQTRTVGLDLSQAAYVNISGIDLLGCAVNGNGATGCVLDGVNVTYGDYFLDSNGYDSMVNRNNILGGSDNVWKNSVITQAAGNGIYLDGKNNVVENCVISDVVWSAGYFAAVRISGENNTVSHCTLKDSGRYLVYHSDAVKANILNNDISGGGQLTLDCGAVYAWGTASDGTVIAYNFVHDNSCNGIYVDNNCEDMTVHHNIVVRNEIGVVMNSAFLRCAVVNNTIIENQNLSHNFTYPGDTPSMLGSVIANNLGQGYWSTVYGNNGPTMNNNVDVGTVNEDYTLPDGDAAIDAGMDMGALTEGFTGAAPDAGALEWGTDPFAYGADLPTAEE